MYYRYQLLFFFEFSITISLTFDIIINFLTTVINLHLINSIEFINDYSFKWAKWLTISIKMWSHNYSLNLSQFMTIFWITAWIELHNTTITINSTINNFLFTKIWLKMLTIQCKTFVFNTSFAFIWNLKRYVLKWFNYLVGVVCTTSEPLLDDGVLTLIPVGIAFVAGPFSSPADAVDGGTVVDVNSGFCCCWELDAAILSLTLIGSPLLVAFNDTEDEEYLHSAGSSVELVLVLNSITLFCL